MGSALQETGLKCIATSAICFTSTPPNFYIVNVARARKRSATDATSRVSGVLLSKHSDTQPCTSLTPNPVH